MFDEPRQPAAEQANNQKLETVLTILFAVSFFARLFERLAYSFSLSGRPLNFSESYAVTEWLINYSAGFLRRGLPGEVINNIYKLFGVLPNCSIAILTLFLFLIYAAIIWLKGRTFAPLGRC